MKLNALVLITSSLFLCSCKKEHKTVIPSNQTFAVKFNVSGFSQSTGGFQTGTIKLNSLAADALSDNVKNLYHLVYDSNGNLVTSQSQVSTASNFGVITDNLKAGIYTVVFVAGQHYLTLSNTNSLAKVFALYYHDLDGENVTLPFNQDTFFKKFSLTVSSTAVTQTVALDRILAGLQINIQDKIPTNAYYFKISFSDYPAFNFTKMAPMLDTIFQVAPLGLITSDTTYTLTSAQKGVAGNSFFAYALNTISPFSVKISCYNQDGSVIYGSTTISNVTCAENKITVLTGNLFGGGSTGNGFSINVDTTWNPPINIPLVSSEKEN